MAQIGLFGGTFDPVHWGHVRTAEAFLEKLALDRVLIMPAFTPPHKQSPGIAATQHRLEMCRLAFAHDARFQVSDYETSRPEKSYTIHTLEYLRGRCPDDALFLLMGGDMLLHFRKWRCWEQIGRLAALAALARLPDEMPALRDEAARLRAEGLRVTLVEAPVVELSSTGLRAAVAEGLPLEELTPPAVAAYIRERGLYAPASAE